jgi:multidrug resistance protein, MATE family
MTLQSRLWAETKALLSLAWPVMLAHLQWILLNLIDTVMVGRYATDQLADLSAARILSWTALVILIGLLSGIVVFVARADGAKTPVVCGQIFRQALLYAAVIGTSAGLILWHIALPVLSATGMAPSMARGGADYVQIQAISFLPAVLQYCGNFFLEGISRPRPAMLITLLTLPLNALFNWLLIYGQFGLPEMGAQGAAWGTLLAILIGVILTHLYIWRMRDRAHYGLTSSRTLSWGASLVTLWREGKALRRFGIVPGLASGFEIGGFSVISAIGTTLGAVPTAAFQAVVSLHMLSLTLSSGLATAAAVRVGNAVGARATHEIILRGWLATLIAASSTALAALLFITIPTPLLAGFSIDQAVISLGAQMLVLLAPFLVFDAAQLTLLFSLRAAGDQVVAGVMQVSAFFIVMCGSAWWLTLHTSLGALGLPLALGLGCLVACILMASRFLWLTRSQGRHIRLPDEKGESAAAT